MGWARQPVCGQYRAMAFASLDLLAATAAVVATAVCLGACTGGVESSTSPNTPPATPDKPAPSPDPVVPGAQLDALAPSDIPRLSHRELADSIFAVLGVDVSSKLSLLPPDSFTPFDNATTLQSPSTALVEGLSNLAEFAATQALATDEGKARVVPCKPSSATDAACFTQFLKTMGRRILHRPLSEAEVAELSGLLSAAAPAQDFYVAVRLALRVLLQDIEFVYRVEIGQPTPVADVVQLSGWELGAKLSYLLWGQTPDDELLASIERGELSTAEQIRAQVLRLLSAPQARSRITRFHGLWLGYEALPGTGLNLAMRAESDALVTRVVLEQRRPWVDLLTASESYVTPELAQLYGMPPPAGGPAWVPYPDQSRRGLLSQGALLANGAKAGATSPTLRGQFILERLLCAPAPPPPPNVKSDVPPDNGAGSNCRSDRYLKHSENPSCAACHSLMDPIGFGLENYDIQGRYREHDEGKPECVITGQGKLPGLGTFRGPAELGAKIAQSDAVKTCLAEHIYQFATQQLIGPANGVAVHSMDEALQASNLSLADGLTGWASSKTFRFRRLPAGTQP